MLLDYNLKDLKLQSDVNYTNIDERLIGVVINKDLYIPETILKRLNLIVNNVLIDYFKTSHCMLLPSEFELFVLIELDTVTNEVLISTYVTNDKINLHNVINIKDLQECKIILNFFFAVLTKLTIHKIQNLKHKVLN